MKIATIILTVSAVHSDVLEDFAENLATSLEPFIGEDISAVSIDEAIEIALPEAENVDITFEGVHLKSIKHSKHEKHD